MGAHISRIGRVSSMFITFRNAAVVSVVIAFAIVTASRADAEETEQTSVKTNVVTAYKTTLQIGEGHELTQALEISDIKFSDPDFGSAREPGSFGGDTEGGPSAGVVCAAAGEQGRRRGPVGRGGVII